MDESKVELKLSKPVQFGKGDPVTHLHFREPIGADLEDMELPPKFGDFLLLAAKISEQPPALIRRLCAFDAQAVVEVAAGFMGGGQETGETSPPS